MTSALSPGTLIIVVKETRTMCGKHMWSMMSFVFELDNELCRFVIRNGQQSVYGLFVCWAESGRLPVVCLWCDMANRINGLCTDRAGKNACCVHVMWNGQQMVCVLNGGRGGLHVVYLWHETTLGCVQGECERWGSTDPGLPESQGMRGCRQATEQVGFLCASLCLVWVSVIHFASVALNTQCSRGTLQILCADGSCQMLNHLKVWAQLVLLSPTHSMYRAIHLLNLLCFVLVSGETTFQCTLLALVVFLFRSSLCHC